jgi:hypothetical protein
MSVTIKGHLPQIACVTRPVPHQVKAMGSIAAALRKRGMTVRETYDRVPSESIVFVWSWKWSKEILERNPNTVVCTLDHGLFAPRNETVVTGWLGLNGMGEHPLVEDGGARLKASGWEAKVKPWRKPGKVALVLGQCYNDVQILDHLEDYGQWLCALGETLRKEGWEVMFRPHPVQRRNDLDRYPRFATVTQGRILQDDLRDLDIGCVAGFNSNALLEAYMEGVEDVRLYNKGSMLYPAARPDGDYRTLTKDIRQPLMERLAYCQWTPKEIADDPLWSELHVPILRRLLNEGSNAVRPWHTNIIG